MSNRPTPFAPGVPSYQMAGGYLSVVMHLFLISIQPLEMDLRPLDI